MPLGLQTFYEYLEEFDEKSKINRENVAVKESRAASKADEYGGTSSTLVTAVFNHESIVEQAKFRSPSRHESSLDRTMSGAGIPKVELEQAASFANTIIDQGVYQDKVDLIPLYLDIKLYF